MLQRTWVCESLFKFLAFNYFGYISRSGSYYNSIFWVTIILLSHQQGISFPISPHLHQHLSFGVFVVVILIVKWHLIVVLMCISLRTSDPFTWKDKNKECISSLEKHFFKSFAFFKNQTFFFFFGFLPGSSPGGSREFEAGTESVRKNWFI